MNPLDLQIKAHEEWLKHPCTQDAFNVLNRRSAQFIKDLQSGILLESNADKENKLRIAIITLKAASILLSDTNQFVEHLNKQ